MMQEYDPKWSASVVLNYFAEIRDIAKVLALCVEQMDDNPPDLIPRLYWLVMSLQLSVENIGDDGFFNAKRLKTYLDELEPGVEDEGDRPGEEDE